MLNIYWGFFFVSFTERIQYKWTINSQFTLRWLPTGGWSGSSRQRSGLTRSWKPGLDRIHMSQSQR